MVGVGPVLMEANYVSDSALFLGARPCSDVPAVASNEQKVLARAHMRTRHCALSLSLMGGGASRALAMRSRGAALVGVGLVLMEVNYSSEATLSLGARPYSDVPAAASNEQPAFACAHTPPHHLTHSLGRRRTTRACSACTLLCAGCKWLVPYGSPLCQRHPLPRRTAVLRRASCGLQQAAFLRICSTARFSLGRRRTTRDCEAFARLRAGWGRSMPYERRLRQRDGPLPRCTAVLRRASSCLHRAAGVRVCAHVNAPPHALFREEAHHARLRRVRAAPRWLESTFVTWTPTAPATRPSPSVHGRALTCQPRPPTSSRRSRVRTRQRANARSLSRGGAPRALAAHARCSALAGVGPCPMKGDCASETALSLGARPRSDVPAAAPNMQLSCACAQGKAPPRALSLSGGGAARALSACARRALLVGVGPCPMEAHRASETALSLGARPRSDVPAAAYNLQQAAFLRMCAGKSATARALSLGRRRSTRACGVRAPRCAGWSRSVQYGNPLRQRVGPLPRCTSVLRRASRGPNAAGVIVCAHANAPPRALSR